MVGGKVGARTAGRYVRGRREMVKRVGKGVGEWMGAWTSLKVGERADEMAVLCYGEWVGWLCGLADKGGVRAR